MPRSSSMQFFASNQTAPQFRRRGECRIALSICALEPKGACWKTVERVRTSGNSGGAQSSGRLAQRRNDMRQLHISLTLAGAIALMASAVGAQEINWEKIDETLGRKAQVAGD